MMTEELPNGQDQMAAEQEEGEILEDGEIADDEDDIVAVGDYSLGQATATKDEKENKESNQSKFGTFSSYYPLDRDDHFKPHKRKKKNNSKKRKRANSIESKRKLPGDVIPNNNLVDISHCIQDASFDSVELSDEDEFNFDLLDFDVLMEILGCSADRELLDSVPLGDKRNVMLRVVKIMKQLHGNDPDTNRRFARLKRRTRERQNSNSNSGVKPAYNKLICKFYIEGKCHKGSDCNYSHDCVVPKRKELCKFYLQGFCGKGDDCLFMHGEFPCKFFHTNTECYSGEKCRFSHAPLTDDTRDILRSYLDSGTLPDDPKPFRPHYSDWTNNNNKNFETPDPESAEFDSSFNFETEQLLSKPRPVILGEPTHRMKSSYDTWKWQQELKELEKAYTGLKKNLFCIDEVFAITEKPLTPRIEDDEDEVEAQIMNYYNDMLDTDEIDEMLALQEIEEHQKKAKEEEENMAKTASENLLDSSSATNEISDEEKRLIEASAHDEDLRVIPGMGSTLGSAFGSPPAISSVFDQVNFGASSNFYPANDGFAPSNPFGDSSAVSAPMESNLDANFPELGAPFGAPSSEITATDVSNMVRQIRNGAGPEPAAPAAAKPEYRDPRLNRIKEPSRVPGSSPNSTFLEKPEEKTVPKPFIKVCNPNVIIDYKLVLIKLSIINYTCYFDLYQNDSALKNDPRLKKFFSSPSNTDQKVATNSDTDFAFSKPKAESDNLIALPSLSIPPIKKSTAVLSPPVPSKILSPLELVSANLKSETESTSSLSLSRDPRIRPKDTDRRRNSDSKVEDVTKSVADQKPLSDMEPEVSSSAAEPSETESAGAELANGTDDLSSIPSYAIAALPSARSLFPSANSNLLFSNLDKLPSPLSASESYSKSSESLDNAHSPSASDEEEEGSLKIQVDMGEEKSDSEPLFLAPSSQDINNWPLNIANNSINDSDNEMEIDLQHHESEVDSENENELIIASSSEPEDNKDCDSQSTDPVSVEDCSLNC